MKYQSVRRRMIVALTLAVVLGTDSWRQALLADDADPEVVRLSEQEQHFNRELFKPHTDASLDAMQTRLQRILKRRLETLDRQLTLSEPQQKKLELAGRGSIKRLIDSIDELRKLYASAERDQMQQFRFFEEEPAMIMLRKRMRTGPFDDDSLFRKTLQSTLTADQTRKQRDLLERATNSKRPINLDSALDLIRIAKIQKDVYRIAWNHNGSEVALVQINKPVELFNLPIEKPFRTIDQVKQAVCFDFHDDGHRVAIAENSHVARIVNLADGTSIAVDTGQSQPFVCFSPDGKALVTGGYGTAVKVWSSATGELIREIKLGTREGGLTPAISPDGKILAVGNRNSTTALIDLETGTSLQGLDKIMSHQLCFDPSGKTIAVTYVDGSLTLWDVATGKMIKTAQAWANELYTVDWSPDGTLLVTGGYHTPVTLWNSTDLSIVNELESSEWVMDVKFSPDGSRLLLATLNRDENDRFVETWAVP